jgi:glucuronoarabinoxylan endo-1,4-beta-xylanase
MNLRQRDSKQLKPIGESAKFQPRIGVPQVLINMHRRTVTALKIVALFTLFPLAVTAKAQTGTPTATVNWSDVQQTIDGWGAQDWGYGDNLTPTQADQFFSPTAGIGLAYLRTQVTFDNLSCTPQPSCGIPDLVTIQEATARGAKIWLELQSPPCNMKHSFVDLGEACPASWNDSFTGPPGWNDGTAGTSSVCYANSFSLATGNTQYAANVVNILQNYAASGITVSVLGITNEPNSNPVSLAACQWSSGTNIANFIKVLSPALAAAGFTPQLLMPQAFNWFNSDYASACLNDVTCAPFVSIVAGHGYGYPFTPTPFPLGTSGGRHLWLSETGDQSSTFDGSISNGLTWATNIHNFLTVANVSAADWWELGYGAVAGGGLANGGLMANDLTTVAKRFYIQGQWSRFVRPSWVRIGATATPVSGVFVTAFKAPVSGNFAIVAVNQSSSGQPLEFALNGFTASSVTPWVTSASLSLTQQPSISATADTFSDTLPASSVTTFVSASSAALLPPTNLHATVH